MNKEVKYEIFEQIFGEGDNKCTMTIFVGGLNSNAPMKYMQDIINDYIENNPEKYPNGRRNILVEKKLDNPWTYVVFSNMGNLKLIEIKKEINIYE